MLIIRRASNGSAFLVIGGVGCAIKNTTDLKTYQAAGIFQVNLTDDGYAAAEARYLTAA